MTFFWKSPCPFRAFVYFRLQMFKRVTVEFWTLLLYFISKSCLLKYLGTFFLFSLSLISAIFPFRHRRSNAKTCSRKLHLIQEITLKFLLGNLLSILPIELWDTYTLNAEMMNITYIVSLPNNYWNYVVFPILE